MSEAESTSSRIWKWASCAFGGCLFMLLLVGSSITALVKSVADREVKTALPPEVAWSKVEAFNSQVGGFTEGCVFGVYRITEQTAQRFKRGDGLPDGWYPTPLKIYDDPRSYGIGTDLAFVEPEDRAVNIFALRATGCAPKDLSAQAKDFWVPLNIPGSRYKILNDGEGLILVSPHERLAWYMYFG